VLDLIVKVKQLFFELLLLLLVRLIGRLKLILLLLRFYLQLLVFLLCYVRVLNVEEIVFL
jgi:hypothetical protein